MTAMRAVGVAVLGLLLLAGTHCRPAPGTRVYVFNVTTGTLTIAGREVEYWHSLPVEVANGSSEQLALARGGQRLGRLVITSLQPAADPNYYDAAINVHEDSASRLHLGEHSPYIDARLE